MSVTNPYFEGLKQHFRNFAADESGAATVEMVVAMAAGISLTLAVSEQVKNGVEAISTNISDTLTNYVITTSFEPEEPTNTVTGQ